MKTKYFESIKDENWLHDQCSSCKLKSKTFGDVNNQLYLLMDLTSQNFNFIAWSEP